MVNGGRVDKGSLRGLRMLMWVALAAVLIFLPLLISSGGADFLYSFVIVPGIFVTGICVLIYAAIRKRPIVALGVATFWLISHTLFFHNIEIRSFTRWFIWSGQYKNKVLAQPASVDGSLKHIEWDGWGWGGQDFSVFLVFDPADSLSVPAESNQSGKMNGIPCEVSGVRRMDPHWYLVYFDAYVDQASWNSCK
jgi:hypothetical protein